MTTITAKVIADSVHKVTGKRLTTFLLRYPRWIHAEGRTHRVLSLGEEDVEYRTPSIMEDKNLSRNASSSRAIPVSKLIQDVIDDPAVPIFWGKNQKGMQAGEQIRERVKVRRSGGFWSNYENLPPEDAWLKARDSAIEYALAYSDAGYHKQIVNRLLEPFSHINVVVSATEWANFFALREHKDAEPHIDLLAQRMKKALKQSNPRPLPPGHWHLPFVSDEDKEDLWLDKYGGMQGATSVEDLRAYEYDLKALSVARCASTSYKTVDGFDMTIDRAIDLHDKLKLAKPMHASPFEHQAQADGVSPLTGGGHLYHFAELHGNFQGFIQYRKTLVGEAVW